MDEPTPEAPSPGALVLTAWVFYLLMTLVGLGLMLVQDLTFETAILGDGAQVGRDALLGAGKGLAVVGLTWAAADEYARKGLRVNAICPTFADTPIMDGLVGHLGMPKEDAFTKVSSRVPMRRVADADEIVQAMIWACSDENSFMTGQALPIDGGLSAV